MTRELQNIGKRTAEKMSLQMITETGNSVMWRIVPDESAVTGKAYSPTVNNCA